MKVRQEDVYELLQTMAACIVKLTRGDEHLRAASLRAPKQDGSDCEKIAMEAAAAAFLSLSCHQSDAGSVDTAMVFAMTSARVLSLLYPNVTDEEMSTILDRVCGPKKTPDQQTPVAKRSAN